MHPDYDYICDFWARFSSEKPARDRVPSDFRIELGVTTYTLDSNTEGSQWTIYHLSRTQYIEKYRYVKEFRLSSYEFSDMTSDRSCEAAIKALHQVGNITELLFHENEIIRRITAEILGHK